MAESDQTTAALQAENAALRAENAQLRQQLMTLEKQEAASMQHYQSFFNHTLDMFCIAGFDGYFKHVNPRWEEVLGLTREELMAQPFIAFVHPEDREATLQEAQQITMTGADIIAFENRYRCKDGSYKHLRWTGRVVPGEQLIYATAHDMSDYKRTQQELQRLNAELQQSQALMQDIAENAPLAIFVKDLQGHYIFLNNHTAAALGYTREQIMGRTDAELLPADTAQRFQSNDEQVIATHQPMTREEVSPQEAHTFVSHKFPIFDAQGSIYAIGGISIDITERKQTEEQLRMFETMVTNAPIGLAYAKPDGAIVYANAAYRTLTGYSDPVGMS